MPVTVKQIRTYCRQAWGAQWWKEDKNNRKKQAKDVLERDAAKSKTPIVSPQPERLVLMEKWIQAMYDIAVEKKSDEELKAEIDGCAKKE